VLAQLMSRMLARLPTDFERRLKARWNPHYPPENMNGLYRSEISAHELASSAIGREFRDHKGFETVKWSQYLVAYDRFLGRFRNGIALPDGSTRGVRFLEIGVREGGSLQVFKKYFGPSSQVFGIDNDQRCRDLDVDDAEIRIGDQSDDAFLRTVVEELGGLDVVIDDGSHLPEHQMASFLTLWPLLEDGGIYIVEDLHTSYWKEFGGGYKHNESFIEFTKDAIDGMHKWYSRHRMTERGAFAMREVLSITLFDSLVVFEKSLNRQPKNLRLGKFRTFR